MRSTTHSRGDQGAVAIIVALFAVCMMILLAFVVDRGRVYAERAQLQNAVDAASLAAVQATCDSPIADASVVRQIAIDYAAANGVTVNPADVIVQDGPNDFTTGVSVAAGRGVSQFFGGFAGVSEAEVAARATATRICTQSFQFVADKDFNFNGGGGGASSTVSGNIFAGKCFDGDGLNFGLVAVSSSEGRTVPNGTDANCRPFLGGSVDYAIWNNSTNVACPAGVDDCAYDVTIGLQQAIAAAGYDIPTINGLLATAGPCPSPTVDQAILDAGRLICTGGIRLANSVTVKYDLVTDGDITDTGGTGSSTTYDATFNSGATAPFVGPSASWPAGRILVYSRSAGIDLKTNNPIPANYVFYAPTNSGSAEAIKYVGGGASMNGTFIGYDVEANGAGASGSAGVQIRFAGPWRLSQ